MPINRHKILLVGLKSLVYLKRGLIWSLTRISFLFIKLGLLGKNIFGFRVLKIGFRFKKLFGKLNLGGNNRLTELLGARWTLQIIIFLVITFLMVPHSRLYTRDTTEIAGQKTLLYKIVGPGEQDFSLDAITFETVSATVQEKTAPNWKEGAVGAQPGATAGAASQPFQPQDIASISSGGMALSKPTILPGAVVPGSTSGPTRTQIVLHTVQTGDTIGSIAEKYRVSIATILWANNLTERSYIRPGNELKILPVSGLLHTVKKGDTIAKIAKLYKTDAEKIIKFNKLKEDGSDVVIGEGLVIPDGLKPQPVYAPSRVYTQLGSVSAPPYSVNAPAGSGYLWPTTVRRITQYFSWRHTGIDIAGPVGTPIYASRNGTVIRSQCGWNGGYGCYIIIDHGGGITTLYGHNSRLYVKVGESVSQGQTIALMGSTGRSTGPHSHFEVRVNGRRVNPFQYVK
ncbi:MAG: peptidoglycan DD-metalloendopeptidase family protein [Candidatus Magasanikbacteria bacterium]|nr:peptidoglycan DD-metalloendopeptidase family protein [Candidatus Magasanikbacteria bacterium]